MKASISILGLLAILLFFVTPALADHPEGEEGADVELGSALHFVDASGADLLVAKGIYRVRASEGTLALEGGDRPAFLLQAAEGRHEIELEAPMALAVPDGADVVSLVLLLPGGAQLMALGTESGVQPRMAITGISNNAMLTHTMMQRYQRDRNKRKKESSQRRAIAEKQRAAAEARRAAVEARRDQGPCTANAASARTLCGNGCNTTANASCRTTCATCYGYQPCVLSCMSSCTNSVGNACRTGCETAYATAINICGGR